MSTILGLGLFIIGATGLQIARIYKRSVIINKRDFINIEKRIRQDERRRVLEDVNTK